jgi:hypothetical protein
MSDGHKKGGVLLPLQSREMPRRACKDRPQESSVELMRNSSKENIDSGRENFSKKKAGKLSEKKRKPFGLLSNSNSNELSSPLGLSTRSASVVDFSSAKIKRLRLIDDKAATCISRGHPRNIVCDNCERPDEVSGCRESKKECLRLFIRDNCVTGGQKKSHEAIKEWENSRLASGLAHVTPATPRSLFEPTKTAAASNNEPKNTRIAKTKDAVLSSKSSGDELLPTWSEPFRYCDGVIEGVTPDVLAFVAKACKQTARFLFECVAGTKTFAGSEYARSKSLLLPLYNVTIQRVFEKGGGFIMKAIHCVEEAQSERSNRCVECGPIARGVRSMIRRCVSPKPENKSSSNRSSIVNIARDETLAEKELRRLREEVRQQKRKIIALENQRNLKFFGTSPVNVQAEKVIQEVFDKANDTAETVLQDESNDDGLDLWKVHYKSMKKTYIAGGKTPATRYDPRILNWAIGLLARTSHSIYADIAKVMMLPDRSYVMRKSSELVSTRGTKSHAMCLNTMDTVDRNLKKMGHMEGSNARVGVISLDAVNCSAGLEWDRHGHKMVGMDETLCYEVVTKQFKKIAANAATGYEEGLDSSEADKVCIVYSMHESFI